MRKYITTKGIWDQEKEDAYIAEVNTLIDEQIKIADNVPKQKISDFVKNTLEVPSYAMSEQIKRFESEGK